MIPDRELFVDTGKHSAYAYFTGTLKPYVGSFSYNKPIKDIEHYLSLMSNKFESTLYNFSTQYKEIDLITFEYIEKYDSLKSEVSISTGSLFKLGLLIGMYCEVAYRLGYRYRLLLARDWKGQLTKEATALRVKRINGQTYKTDHITDAVGMGLSKDKDIWNLKTS